MKGLLYVSLIRFSVSSEQPTSLTGLHKNLRALIQDMGLEVEDEVQVGRYRVDCYVREVHGVVEADGTPWHSGPAKRKKQRERDAWLLSHAGLHVLHIEPRDIRNREAREVTRKLIELWIEHHAHDYEHRKQIGRPWGLG